MNQRNNQCERRKFLVTDDCMAKKAPVGSNNNSTHAISDGLLTREKRLERGTLLEEFITDWKERTSALHKSRQIIVSVFDNPTVKSNNLCFVDLNKLETVESIEAQLLLAIDAKDRLKYLHNKELLNDAKWIDEGALVRLRLTDYNGIGLVIRKGFFAEFGKGILFAIKFLKNADDVLSVDGVMRNSKQRGANDEFDVVVSFDKLRLWKPQHSENSTLSLGSKSKLQQQQLSSNNASASPAAVKNVTNDSSQVAIGERVAWITDGGPEYGVVKWIGTISGQPQPIVGVEFDNPVGSGTGLHNNEILFNAKRNHASLIPISGLIREVDFKPPAPPTGSSKKGLFFAKKKKRDKRVANSYEEEAFLAAQKPEHTYIKSLDTIKDMHLQQLEADQKSAYQQQTEKHSTPPPSPLQYQSNQQLDYGTAPVHKQQTHSRKSRNDYSQSDIQANLVPKDESVQLSQPAHYSSQSILSTLHDNHPQNDAVQIKTFDVGAVPESQKRISTEYLFANGLINGDCDVKQDQESSSRVSTPLQKKQVDRLSNAHPSNIQNGSKSNVSPVSRRRSPSVSKADMLELNARLGKLGERSLHSEEKVSKEPVEASVPHKYYASVVDLKPKSEKYNMTNITIHGNKPELSNYNHAKPDFCLSSALRSSMHNLPIDELISRQDSYISDDFKGNTNSLPKNGFSCLSETQKSPFEEHDFLFGSDTGNLDVLESFHGSTASINDSFAFNNHLLDGGSSFEVGSVVEVIICEKPAYGVIRWIGYVPGADRKVAGLEMEDEIIGSSCDGTFDNKKYFSCPPGKGFYIYLDNCRRDGRFLESIQPFVRKGINDAVFGSIDCPTISGDVAPLKFSDKLLNDFGKNKGIQGHHNSCYLDATLFSMFTFTSVFDSILHRPPMPSDIQRYQDVQKVLKEDIVNPLRQNLYVRADRVMKLRTLLEDLGSVSGLTCEEKDPEEFLNSLLHQILKAEPFLKLSSGQESYFYQLFVEKNENLQVPTVQQLFDQSFLTSDIKLKEIPPCLIIQMPRFGKQYKMYKRIFPSLVLDITDVLENSPRQCSVCGNSAVYECRECFYQFGPQFTMKAFCSACISRVHSHKSRAGHSPRKILSPPDFEYLPGTTVIPRIQMDLFAVVCIETSHYVAFVKCGNEPNAPWCFFDSMADRKGEQNGYNIPEVVFCPEVSEWLSEEKYSEILAEQDIQLMERGKRLFGDAYMCMYQSSSVMMYH